MTIAAQSSRPKANEKKGIPISSSSQPGRKLSKFSTDFNSGQNKSTNVKFSSKTKLKFDWKWAAPHCAVWGSMNRKEVKPPLTPHQPVLYIECCPVNIMYRQQAHDLHRSLSDALHALKADLQLQLRINEVRTPRHGSFEVYIAPKPTGNAHSRHMLWTGISRVPAAAKVPHVDDIIVPACHVLKLRHRAMGSSQHNMVIHSDRHIQRIMQRRSGE